jgi:flagellin-specific chaperone FliS
MTSLERTYRTAATGGGLALIIALFDTLAGDLRRAAEAERNSNLTQRTRELVHALLVLAYLEDRLNHGTGGELAGHLAGLYKAVRSKIIAGQVRRSSDLLEEAMTDMLRVRENLQKAEQRASQAIPDNFPPVALSKPASYPTFEPRNTSGNWSA